MERHGELFLEQEVKNLTSSMSAATVDRPLRPQLQGELRRPFSITEPGTLLKAAIPVRTYAGWNEERPRFLEIHPVVHCEGEALGPLPLHSLQETGPSMATDLSPYICPVKSNTGPLATDTVLE